MNRQRYVIGLTLMLALGGCGGEPKKDAAADDVCQATYAKLEELGCVDHYKRLVEHGCFLSTEMELVPTDCDLSQLNYCSDQIAKFDEPLDSFLQRKCGAKGSKAIDVPQPDMAALRRAKAEAAQAEPTSPVEAAPAPVDAALEQARARASVRVGDVEVQGKLSKASVTEALDAVLPSLRECHAAALVASPAQVGKVSINFVIVGDGLVGTAIVQESALDAPELERCLCKAIKASKFSAPGANANVIVTATFELELAT